MLLKKLHYQFVSPYPLPSLMEDASRRQIPQSQWRWALMFSLICTWTKDWVKIETPVIWEAIALLMTSLIIFIRSESSVVKYEHSHCHKMPSNIVSQFKRHHLYNRVSDRERHKSRKKYVECTVPAGGLPMLAYFQAHCLLNACPIFRGT